MNGPEQRVTVVDLRIPFFRLVFFFVKVALAAIPAAIILSIIAFVVSAVFWAIFGGSPGFLERWRM
jgi:hypothetical protein